MDYQFDPDQRTFLYIMFVETVSVTPENASMEGTPVVCRWYADNGENHCSKPFILSASVPSRSNYCTFIAISFANLADRSRSITMTLSAPDGAEHLCVAFLDLGSFSQEEAFKAEMVELKNSVGVVATAQLSTAAQHRWTQGTPVVIRADACFVEPEADYQAQILYDHIVAEAVSNASNDQTGAAATQALEQQRLAEEYEAEQKRKQHEEAERQRKHTEEQEAKRRMEEERREEAKRFEQEARREAERKHEERGRDDRERASQDEHRREDERDKQRFQDDTRHRDVMNGRRDGRDDGTKSSWKSGVERSSESEERGQRRTSWEAEEELERRRREEWDRDWERRRARDDRDRLDERPRSHRDEQREQREQEDDRENRFEPRLRERRQWEEDRERLRREAQREKKKELEERTRRAEERRRQVETIANARLAAELRDRHAGPATLSVGAHGNAQSPRLGKHGAHIAKDNGRAATAASAASRLLHTDTTEDALYQFSARIAEQGKIQTRSSSAGIQGNRRTAGRQNTTSRSHRSSQGLHNSLPPGSDSELSEPCPFDVEECEGEHGDEAQQLQGGWSWSRSRHGTGITQTRKATSLGPATRGTGSLRPKLGAIAPTMTARPLGMRMEALKASSQQRHGPLSSTVEETLLDGGGGSMHLLENTPLSPIEMHRRGLEFGMPGTAAAAPGFSDFARRSLTSTPRRRSSLTSLKQSPRTEARRQAGGLVNGVVAAALADAERGSFTALSGPPVAAVEECVLRLLVLQRELSATEDPDRSALADAAAGLAPRMLTVLEAARNVCEANRAKLKAFCEEKRLDFDGLVGGAGTDYMRSQLGAIDRLHSQYSTLLAGSPSAQQASIVSSHTHLGLTPMTGSPHYGPGSVGFSENNHHPMPLHHYHLYHQQQLQQTPQPQQLQQPQQPQLLQLQIPQEQGSWPTFKPGAMAAMAVSQFEPSPRQMVYAPSYCNNHIVEARQAAMPDLANGLPVPSFRSSGSSPPPAKFREHHVLAGHSYPFGTQSESNSAISSARVPHAAGADFEGWSAANKSSGVPAISHWDRRLGPAPKSDLNAHDPSHGWAAAHHRGEPASNCMSARGSPSEAARASPMGHAGQSGPGLPGGPGRHAWSDQVSGWSPNSPHVTATSQAPRGQQPPLKAALQQMRGVAEGLTGRSEGRDTRGGHAPAASSKLPRRGNQEDKYLKILQTLQAKGAVSGGLAAHLLEGSGMKAVPASGGRNKQAVASIDESSSSDEAPRSRGGPKRRP